MTSSAIGRATVSPRRRSFSEIDTIEFTSSWVLPTSATASECALRMSSVALPIRVTIWSTVSCGTRAVRIRFRGRQEEHPPAVIREQRGDAGVDRAVRERRGQQRIDDRDVRDLRQIARQGGGDRDDPGIVRVDAVDEQRDGGVGSAREQVVGGRALPVGPVAAAVEAIEQRLAADAEDGGRDGDAEQHHPDDDRDDRMPTRVASDASEQARLAHTLSRQSSASSVFTMSVGRVNVPVGGATTVISSRRWRRTVST